MTQSSPPPPPLITSNDRVRLAFERRHESDYVFSFWSAFGWTLLTLGVYGLYVFYQLMRRMRDHNLRRLELLEGATAFAWERAHAMGLSEELRPSFERIASNTSVLRGMTSNFRDPVVWTILAIVASGIVQIIGFIFLDGDLVKHDYHEGAIETDLAAIYARLGAPVPSPDPSRLKGKHNYAGRIVATLLTCFVYGFWWLYNMMNEPNRHFEQNWAWEDALAGAVQRLAA